MNILIYLVAAVLVALVMWLAWRAMAAPRTGDTDAARQPAPPPAAPPTVAASAPPAAPASSDQPAGLSATEVFVRLHELALGPIGIAPMDPALHARIARATALALVDGATQQRYAPRRPSMLPRLLSAANDERVSLRELSAIITRDPSLVGALLKIANSSYYRVSPEPVESVDRAVVMLGTDGIRSLITAALMQPIFRVRDSHFPYFAEIAWEHTFRAASAAVPHSFLVENADPFAAELLALVTGLATIVIFRIALDQYSLEPGVQPDAGTLARLLDEHASEVARRIGVSWELSQGTLSGLETPAAGAAASTPLGRSLQFGRVVGALAVLHLKGALDETIARASIPPTSLPDAQIERMWSRLLTREP
jgi:hypothetical protein